MGERTGRTNAISVLTVFFGILSLGMASCARGYAQNPPPAPAPAVGDISKTNLQATLAHLRPLPNRFLLAVGAERVGEAPGVSELSNRPSPNEIAAHFGDVVTRFGAVYAFGAAQMTVLNPNPTDPDIWDGIPATDAVKYFLGSLDAQQYAAITSQNGIGYGDLHNSSQKSLYLAVIDSHDLRVQDNTLLNNPPPLPVLTYPQDLPKSRLRFGQRIHVGVPMAGGGFTFSLVPARYYLMQDSGVGTNGLFGVPSRASIAHTPKKGQLDFKSPEFRVLVPLTGLHTVQDLISQIATTTHSEIYADPHYEKRSVTIVGASPTASAADLLQGLAFCVVGTYRKVGPAYVLTNDLLGVGTVRERWQQFEADGNAMREQALVQATKKLMDLPDPKTLPVLNTELAYTPEQAKAAAANQTAASITRVILPFQKLTQAQQQEAQHNWDTLVHTPEIPVDTQKVELGTSTEIQLLIPSLDEPVVIATASVIFIDRQNAEQQKADNTAPSPPPPPLTHLASTCPYRAVLAKPTAAVPFAGLTAMIHKAGLSELWLDCSMPDAIGPAPLIDSETADTKPLSSLLKTTKDIHVAPVMDLFLWSKAPDEDADLTILGETYAQAAARLQKRDAMIAAAHGDNPPAPGRVQVAVSPFSPDVVRTLTAAVKQAAHLPQIDGLVWRNTLLPGYSPVGSPVFLDSSLQCGYTLEGRLAFLRKWHCDPLDIDPTYSQTVDVDTSLPEFDDWTRETERLDPIHWQEFRAEADQQVLQALYRTAQASQAKGQGVLPIFVQQRHSPDAEHVDWFGPWTGADALFPDAFPPSKDQDPPPTQEVTHRLALINIRPINGPPPASSDPAPFELSDLPDPTWGGFVLNLTSWLNDASTASKASDLLSNLMPEKTH